MYPTKKMMEGMRMLTVWDTGDTVAPYINDDRVGACFRLLQCGLAATRAGPAIKAEYYKNNLGAEHAPENKQRITTLCFECQP